MDIERMQKINKLAKELMQRGMAEDMIEATKQAELMINKDDSSISNVFRSEQRSSGTNNANSNTNARKEENHMDAGQEEEVRMQLRKLTTQINDQSKVISDLKLNVMNIISEINRMKLEPKRPAIIERPRAAGSDQSQTVINKEAVEQKPHARSGNYSPGDVTIEKFFYSGPPR